MSYFLTQREERQTNRQRETVRTGEGGVNVEVFFEKVLLSEGGADSAYISLPYSDTG